MGDLLEDRLRQQSGGARAASSALDDPTLRPSTRPDHYGGESDIYEARKVIRAWKLGFNLGNAAKYMQRAGKKPGADRIDDLRKARQYLDFEIMESIAEEGAKL